MGFGESPFTWTPSKNSAEGNVAGLDLSDSSGKHRKVRAEIECGNITIRCVPPPAPTVSVLRGFYSQVYSSIPKS